MAMSDAALQILINAKNNASRELGQVSTDVSGLSRAAGVAAKAAGALGIALGALQLGRTAFEMGRATASSMRLEAAFQGLAASAGGSGDAMLAAMRQAAQGTIDDTTLIQAANRAMMLGVADSADEMASLIEVASARGKAMGLTTAEAFDQLVTGIGRMSAPILDNLGIVIDAEGAYRAYAAQIGVSAENLDDAQRKAALLNGVMASSEALLGDNASQSRDMAASFERMDSSIANAKDALGALFSPVAAQVAEQIANATDRATAAMQNMTAGPSLAELGSPIQGVAEQLADAIDDLKNAAITADLPALEDAKNRISLYTTAIHTLGEAYNETAAKTGAPLLDLGQLVNGVVVFQDMAAALDQVAEAEQRATADATRLSAAQQRLRGEITATLDRLREIEGIAASASGALSSSFKGAIGELGAAGAFQGYQAANAELQGMIAHWETIHDDQEMIDFLTSEYVRQIQDANMELGRTEVATSAVSSAASDAAAAFESLKSKVAGVLSAQLDPGVGVDVDSLLPRADAINEDARRLADVAVNGFDSPWAEYLNEKFPELFKGAFEGGGDLKTAAAQVLRDFQDGLVPELLDKDQAKERIKRMLLGEANMAELAQEIAQELTQEMGGQFSVGQIQGAVNMALGQSGEAAPEEDAFGQGMLTALRDNQAGAKLIAELASQVKAGFAILLANGREAGAEWGRGFTAVVKENVPPELVAILTELVTPEVYARLRIQTSLTGAEE